MTPNEYIMFNCNSSAAKFAEANTGYKLGNGAYANVYTAKSVDKSVIRISERIDWGWLLYAVICIENAGVNGFLPIFALDINLQTHRLTAVTKRMDKTLNESKKWNVTCEIEKNIKNGTPSTRHNLFDFCKIVGKELLDNEDYVCLDIHDNNLMFDDEQNIVCVDCFESEDIVSNFKEMCISRLRKLKKNQSETLIKIVNKNGKEVKW